MYRHVAVVWSCLCCLLPAQEPGRSKPRPRGPGYYDTMPSAEGRQRLQNVYGTRFHDRQGVLGGGVWEVSSGGVTPHPLGPGRGDVMELRSVHTKGPHVQLRRGALAFFLPTRCDGDVAALLRLLGREVPDGLQGEPSAQWRQAIARVRGLGPARGGLRVGVAPGGRPGTVVVTVWRTGDEALDWTGSAQLRLGTRDALAGRGDAAARELALTLRWPPQLEDEGCRLQLSPGATFEQDVALPGPADGVGDAAGRDDPDALHVEVVLQGARRAADEPAPPPVTSATVPLPR